jgi:Protein of unknown function (DUF2917)
MAGAVFNDNRKTWGVGVGGRFTDREPLPANTARPESWLQRTVQKVASLIRKNPQATFGSGIRRISKGEIERRHLPTGGRIYCQTGKVWITADGGGEDVVLSSGEFRSFRPGVWLLIEAIARSEIIVEA